MKVSNIFEQYLLIYEFESLLILSNTITKNFFDASIKNSWNFWWEGGKKINMLYSKLLRAWKIGIEIFKK